MNTSHKMKVSDASYCKKLLKKCGKTINKHSLVSSDDHILVALSGGKDSLAMLDMLSERRKHLPVTYKITAAFINTIGITESVNQSILREFCQQRDTTFISESIEVDFTQNADPCFACSWHRRKILFNICRDRNINSLALGHTLNDTTNTLLMNIMFQGNFSSMTPMLKLFDGKLSVIRPLIEISEEDIIRYCSIKELPIQKAPCEYGKAQTRGEIDTLLSKLERRHPHIRQNIYSSLTNIHTDYLPNQNTLGTPNN
ncbi:MAG: hypothetical protein PF637_14400 [Spirochaetes bacterium]|jgi:tRNA 2-thiocytidine biosynthesis protein TtcA|nr:hypothetical protein [Spirochaetota bacterium]